MNANKAGETLRILRKAAEMTTSELAKKSGASIPLLSLIEKGERIPSIELLKKISLALEIPYSSLILLLADSDDVQSNDPYANDIVDAVKELSRIENHLRNLIKRQ